METYWFCAPSLMPLAFIAGVTANNDYFVLPLEHLELHVIVPIKNRSDNRRSIQVQPASTCGY
ncbi:MAG TPA: hypothetical protein VF360_01885 [Candidatus Methanoperedens sp.]